MKLEQIEMDGTWFWLKYARGIVTVTTKNKIKPALRRNAIVFVPSNGVSAKESKSLVAYLKRQVGGHRVFGMTR
ncbi:hypothetical protein KXD40_000164 [Peronospora effusa]|uniref:Uncharacterized protein n=1 Tax=Peronospora effusa TaxID=542832 RepID=A0A3M6VJ89_9STRA|nr:hypothetical protein DD238_001251 [Peronospora effusa]RQM17216.1 hypothetical protein DD237_001836 [Peronospora effusa]UIZ20739.1 hypothetical protein KXD40_000164 [Peronospora effusa]CAI5718424.1 unnamed protein product [Peronospora effusa]